MGGWIKDFRKEIESDIWLMPPLYHRVWQWLKYSVNRVDAEIPMRDGTTFKILQGQKMTSLRGIAKEVGWYEGLKWKEPNPKTITTILSWLVKNSMIHLTSVKGNSKGNGGYSLITLVNWGLYQLKESESNSQSNSRETVGKQYADINNKDKEVKKNKKICPTFKISDEYLPLVTYFKDVIKARKQDYKFTVSSEKWAEIFRLMIERDGRTEKNIKEVFTWCQADGFWQNNILSPDKLRKQFDRLELEKDKNKPQQIDKPKKYDLNGILLKNEEVMRS